MHKLVKHAGLATLLLALGGCASGPDYKRPTFAFPTHWFASSGSAAEGVASTPLPDWRAYFTDARLQALIDQALEHNHDLRIATARIAEARALHGIQRVGKFPEFDLFGRREASLTPGDLNMLGRPLNAQRYDVGVELLDYELDFWGRVRRLDEAALAAYLASEEAQRAFRLSLIADVANAYFSQSELRERVRLAREIAENRGEVTRLSAQRREAGLIGSMEYLRTAAADEAARSEVAALEQASAAADHWLQLLTGTLAIKKQAPPPEHGLTLAEQGMPRLAPNIPADVLLQRPDVLAAEQRLIAASANIGAARAAFLPRITLTGALSTASGGLSGLFESGSRAWLFKPKLRLPLFDGGRNDASVDLAEARKNIAVAEYEKTLQQAFREVADLLAGREALTEQLRAQEANQRIQEERARLYAARYQAQISHHLEVLDARRDLLAAGQAVQQARRAALANAAQLYKALGGAAAETKPRVAPVAAVE